MVVPLLYHAELSIIHCYPLVSPRVLSYRSVTRPDAGSHRPNYRVSFYDFPLRRFFVNLS